MYWNRMKLKLHKKAGLLRRPVRDVLKNHGVYRAEGETEKPESAGDCRNIRHQAGSGEN